MSDGARPPPCPAWVRWVARDSDGTWWGYSVEPLRHEHGWYENEVGRYVRLGDGAAHDWEHSLQAVSPDDPGTSG